MPKQRLLFLVALLAGTLLLACEAVSGVLTPTPTYNPISRRHRRAGRHGPAPCCHTNASYTDTCYAEAFSGALSHVLC